MRLKKTIQTIGIISGSALLVAVVAGALVASAWYLHGGRIAAVQSDSMQPLFSTGDALLVSPAPSYGRGDIVQYQNPSNPSVTISHRVEHSNKQTGRLITKGDALSNEDQDIPVRLVHGRVVAIIPGFGRLIDQLYKPKTLLMVIYVPALVLLVTEAWRLVKELRMPYRIAGYRT